MTQSDKKQHRPQRLGSIAAMIVAGQMLVAAPLVAQGVPTTAPETSAAPAQTGTVAPAVPTAETAAPQTTVPAVDAAAAPATATPEGLVAEPVPADQAGATPVVTEIEPEPMPNMFHDPAGAVSHVFSRHGRNPALPHDLSPWGMFRQADIVVKVVMLGLAFASLVTWTIFVAKSLELLAAKRRARKTLLAVHSARSLDDALRQSGNRRGPAALMLRSAQAELETSEPAIDYAGGAGVKERVEAALRRIEAGAGRKVSIGTGILATIGSTAPFVGLFGTVWGIMNAFIGISKSQTTNLAVVAPGIAEALLATALGLVAAIPAVIIYNHFARMVARYRQVLSDAGVGVEILVSRDLDFRKVPQTEIVRARQAAE